MISAITPYHVIGVLARTQTTLRETETHDVDIFGN